MNCNRLLACVLVLLVGGCAQHLSIVPTHIQGFATWSDAIAPHRLAAGDDVELKFLFNPDLNARLTVGPDGRMTAPLLGPVQASGLTIAEFTKQLEQAYAPKLRVPTLDVVVRLYASSRFFVGGEVKAPGVLPLVGPIDVLQGVVMAGGFLPTARTDEVVVIRRRADNVPMLRTVNVNRYAGQATVADDFPLQPSDVIFVPRSDIAELDLFVDQYLNQSLPFTRSLNYNLGSGGAPLF